MGARVPAGSGWPEGRLACPQQSRPPHSLLWHGSHTLPQLRSGEKGNRQQRGINKGSAGRKKSTKISWKFEYKEFRSQFRLAFETPKFICFAEAYFMVIQAFVFHSFFCRKGRWKGSLVALCPFSFFIMG